MDDSGQKAVLITALHSPSSILPSGSSSRVVDLTDSVPGYTEEGASLSELTGRIKAECEPSKFLNQSSTSRTDHLDTSAGEKVSIFIDALDILAEDYSTSGALRLFRDLLQLVKESKRQSTCLLSLK